MRRDPVDVEVEARLELAAASRRVRRELDGILLELAHFRRTNMQMIAEGQREVPDQVKRLTAGFDSVKDDYLGTAKEQMKSAQEAAYGALGASLEGFTADISSASKNMAAAALAVEGVGPILTDALQGFVDRLKAAKGPDEVLKIELQPVIDRLADTIARATSSLSEQLKESQTSREAVDRAVVQLGALAEAIEAQVEILSRRRRAWPTWPIRQKGERNGDQQGV
jgi:hypothetical protein